MHASYRFTNVVPKNEKITETQKHSWFLFYLRELVSYFSWSATEAFICVLVSLNEQKFSIATIHLGEYREKKNPHKWMTSVPLLKNLEWFYHLWHSFCCWGNSVLNIFAFCFVSQIHCGVSTSVAFMPLSCFSPKRPCKRSKIQSIRILQAVQSCVQGKLSLTSSLRVWWMCPTAVVKWC